MKNGIIKQNRRARMNDAVEDELNQLEWLTGLGTMLEVCRRFIQASRHCERLQFVNGHRRGVIECTMYLPGKDAYYRDGRVFEINSMMIAPSGGDIVHRTALALFGDRTLGLDCLRIENVMDDDLLRRFRRKGWVLNDEYDYNPKLTRVAYVRIQTLARRITRAIRKAV